MRSLSLDTVKMNAEVKSAFTNYVNSRIYGSRAQYISLESDEEVIYFIVGLLELYYNTELELVHQMTKAIEYKILEEEPVSKEKLVRFRMSFSEYSYLSTLYEGVGYSKLSSYGKSMSRLAVSFGKGLFDKGDSQHIIDLLKIEMSLTAVDL